MRYLIQCQRSCTHLVTNSYHVSYVTSSKECLLAPDIVQLISLFFINVLKIHTKNAGCRLSNISFILELRIRWDVEVCVFLLTLFILCVVKVVACVVAECYITRKNREKEELRVFYKILFCKKLGWDFHQSKLRNETSFESPPRKMRRIATLVTYMLK